MEVWASVLIGLDVYSEFWFGGIAPLRFCNGTWEYDRIQSCVFVSLRLHMRAFAALSLVV